MKRFCGVMVVCGVAASLAACGDYQIEKYQDIGPNETAFVIPLEGKTTDGDKFDSEAVVEKMKVAAKRITIPTREFTTGRGPGNYTWIPTVRVITVHRAAVTAEWTNDEKTGTSDKDEAIELQSRDGIRFHVGCTVTAHIDEQHAAKFLYNWGVRELKEVVDTNVRSFVQTTLMQSFGDANLSDCLANRGQYFLDAAKALQDEFLGRGVTIDFFGPQGGLTFDNKENQETLDKRFQSENSKKIAENETLAQVERNKQLVAQKRGLAEMQVIEAEANAKVQIAQADGEATATKARAAANAFQILEVAKAEAEGNRLRAEALAGNGGARLVSIRQIEKWGGNVPNFIMGGNGQIPFLSMPTEALEASKTDKK